MTPTPKTLRGLVAGMTICSPGCTKCLAEHADILSAADAWEASLRDLRDSSEQIVLDNETIASLQRRLAEAEKVVSLSRKLKDAALSNDLAAIPKLIAKLDAALAGEK